MYSDVQKHADLKSKAFYHVLQIELVGEFFDFQNIVKSRAQPTEVIIKTF